MSCVILAVETTVVTSLEHDTVRCLAQNISVELTLVWCCRVSPPLVALMVLVVNVEESQHYPAVEHFDEQGTPPAIRPQLACRQLRRRMKLNVMTVRSSRRLEGIVADGLCLYCCILASEDLASWTLTHVSVTNTAHDREVRDRDLSNAKLLRSGFVGFWTTRADRAMQPARLKEEGPEDYPEMEDLQFLARMLGSQIVLHTNHTQIVYGDGPLYIHIAYASSVDGAGHNSSHYVIYQSWCELVNRPNHRGVSTTQR